MQLQITNISEQKGCIRLAIFDSADHFEAETAPIFTKVIELESAADISVDIPSLGEGEYAVAAYHDVNNNGKLDKNGLGIPQEPYAFSNNASAKWKAPTFQEVAFDPSTYEGTIMQLELKRWADR